MNFSEKVKSNIQASMKAKIGLKSKINRTFVKGENLILGSDFLSNRDWIISKEFLRQESLDNILNYREVKIQSYPEEDFESFLQKMNKKQIKNIYKTDLLLDFQIQNSKEIFRCFISEDGKRLNFFKEKYIDYFGVKTLQADKNIGVNVGKRKGLIVGGLIEWEKTISSDSILSFIHGNNLI